MRVLQPFGMLPDGLVHPSLVHLLQLVEPAWRGGGAVLRHAHPAHRPQAGPLDERERKK